MNQHPVVLLDPVFRWLDHLVRDYGLYIYMVCVWLSPLLIAWILSGGFWRRPPRRRYIGMAPLVIQQTKATPPPLPPIIGRKSSPLSDDDEATDSFAA
ncbi:MAG: hypothetical protein DME21_12765 [Verrucomicrobia bacterium]|nr:MAG: hypothetical protein DME21_12765 [Verrucomicrobiota bacterium]